MSNLITAIANLISAILEGLKVALVYDAGRTKAKLEAMENEAKLLDAVRAARNATGVSLDDDPYNRDR